MSKTDVTEYRSGYVGPRHDYESDQTWDSDRCHDGCAEDRNQILEYKSVTGVYHVWHSPNDQTRVTYRGERCMFLDRNSYSEIQGSTKERTTEIFR